MPIALYAHVPPEATMMDDRQRYILQCSEVKDENENDVDDDDDVLIWVNAPLRLPIGKMTEDEPSSIWPS